MAYADRLLEQFRHLRRVEQIYDRYCREGKRPSRAEAADWLRSEGWEEWPLKNLLDRWYGLEN